MIYPLSTVSTQRSIGIVTYTRLLLRCLALIISIVSLVIVSCWPYSLPLVATSTSHGLVSGHVFIQYLFLKDKPSLQTLQDLSTAKTGENINTILQTTLGFYFLASYLLKDPPFNKTTCSMIDPNKSEIVLQIVLITFSIVQILDCIAFVVQFRFIRTLKTKYIEEKSKRIENTEQSAKPIPSTMESHKQAEPPPPSPSNTTPTKTTEKIVITGDEERGKEKEPLLVAAKIPVEQVKAKPKEMLSNPSCPSEMSFNEKDIGNLKEVEKELMDLLKNNEDPHSAKPSGKQPEPPPRKVSKARKKKSEQKQVVDLLDKTQLSESDLIRTERTQTSQTRTVTGSNTNTNTRNTQTGNKSSESKVSI